jgi:2-polyprenyl-3-methyl-5-hydroxy-6-metoxy-1,4-benzoquinol methylase
MNEIQPENEIRSRNVSKCYLCGSKGKTLYQNLQDYLFGTSGLWSLSKCSNQDCQLIWLNPMPIEEDIGIAYKSYYTHAEDANNSQSWLRNTFRLVKNCYLANKYGYFRELIPLWKRPLGFLLYLHLGKRIEVDMSVMCIPKQTNGYLLDIGCGNGDFLHTMQQLGWAVQGIEFDETAASVARQRNINVMVGTLEDACFPESSFDVVVLSHVIEHVYDPIHLLSECKRVMKPDGRIIIVTPNVKSLCQKIFRKDWRGNEVPRHIMLFSESTLAECISRAGFEPTKHYSVSRMAKGIFLASQGIRRGRKNFKPMLWDKILGTLIQLLEELGFTISKYLGEELFFLGVKKL